MESTFNILATDLAREHVRARRAETQLRAIERMLSVLGVSLWETDANLRLTASHGLVVAESYLDRHVGEFCRDVYGAVKASSDPIAAHYEAQAGRGVTLAMESEHQRYAILVEPKRDGEGKVAGTVGMSVRVV